MSLVGFLFPLHACGQFVRELLFAGIISWCIASAQPATHEEGRAFVPAGGRNVSYLSDFIFTVSWCLFPRYCFVLWILPEVCPHVCTTELSYSAAISSNTLQVIQQTFKEFLHCFQGEFTPGVELLVVPVCVGRAWQLHSLLHSVARKETSSILRSGKML